jgi:hypothetical protein
MARAERAAPRAFGDQVPQIRHLHVTTEPGDQRLFAILAAALTVVTGEPHHAIGPFGERWRLIGHLCLFLFLVFLVRESFFVTKNHMPFSARRDLRQFVNRPVFNIAQYNRCLRMRDQLDELLLGPSNSTHVESSAVLKQRNHLIERSSAHFTTSVGRPLFHQLRSAAAL